jgi:protein involved in polysaccharide export with SLBB domain
MYLLGCLSLALVSSSNALDSPRDLYKIGIGDEIEINIAGHENLSVVSLVAFDGTVTVPYLGAIYVEDLTLDEVKSMVTEELGSGYVQSPIVSVFLRGSGSKRIFVQGAGEIPYQHNLTVARVLFVSGKVGAIEPRGKLIVRRKNENDSKYEDIVLSVRDILAGKDSGDMPIHPDDIILFEGPETFIIQGAVSKAGKYPLDDNMTIGRALSVAGGISEGALHGTVKIRRILEDESGYKDTTLDVRSIIEGGNEGEMLLQPNDIVTLEPNSSFYIHGAVKITGKYDLEDNMTVVKAITEAGGITEDGLYGEVKIRRKREREMGYEDIAVNLTGIIDGAEADMLLEPDDILIVERNKSFLMQGEVNNPGIYVLEGNMTIGKAITIAGGITEGSQNGKIKVRRFTEDKSGYNDINFDLQDILEGDAHEDFHLEPDDVVKITRGKTFIIYGEVSNIGEYTISKDMTVFKAILMAGGFNKWGSPSRIKILRPKNDGKSFDKIKVNIKKLLNGDPDADVPVMPGDIIIVSSGIL